MKRRESLGLDLTPIIDVVFILLIFFIVSSVFKKEELALMLDLPTSNAKEMKVDEEQIFIELNKNKFTASVHMSNDNGANIFILNSSFKLVMSRCVESIIV